MGRETRVAPQPLGEKGQHFPLRDGLSFPLSLWSGCARGHGDSYPCVTQNSPCERRCLGNTALGYEMVKWEWWCGCLARECADTNVEEADVAESVRTAALHTNSFGKAKGSTPWVGHAVRRWAGAWRGSKRHLSFLLLRLLCGLCVRQLFSAD